MQVSTYLAMIIIWHWGAHLCSAGSPSVLVLLSIMSKVSFLPVLEITYVVSIYYPCVAHSEIQITCCCNLPAL